MSLCLLLAAIQRVMGVVLVLLEAPSQQQQQQQQAYTDRVVQTVLTTPHLVSCLPAAIKVSARVLVVDWGVAAEPVDVPVKGECHKPANC